MKTTAALSLIFAFASGLAVSSAATVSFDFNTPGSTEGWAGSAHISGLQQATTSIGGGGEGVLTANDLTGNDPMVSRSAANTINFPAGDNKWSTIVIRFRQLDGNPGALPAPGPAAYATSGTILFFNGATGNLGTGAVDTRTATGVGTYAGDIYGLTRTTEASGEWQLFTVDLSAAPTLAGAPITAVRFDPVGNVDTKNFEIDYIRFNAVPEPTGIVLTALAALGLTMIRRRK